MQFLAIPSLRWRLIVVMCVAYIVVALATGVLSYKVQENSLHNQLLRQAQSDASLLAVGSLGPLSTAANTQIIKGQLQNFQAALRRNARGILYSFVAGPDGSIVAHQGTQDKRDTAQIAVPQAARTLDLPGGRVEAIYPVFSGNLYGFAGVILSDEQYQSDLSSSLIWDSALGVLGLIIFILLSLVIARFILGPLAVLARAAEAIRRGELSARIMISEGTELGTVAEAFNDMARTLEQRIIYLSFLAESGAILPNTFREAGDINQVLRQFCERLDAAGVCLTFPAESTGKNVYYSRNPDQGAWQVPALAFGERATSPRASVERGYAIMAVPVVEGAEFVTARQGNRPFTVEEQQLVTNFAYQVGIAADNARLFEAQQEALRVKDQFLSIVSHELRTPLTTIKGYAQMLRRKLVNDDEGMRFADTIDAQVGRLSRLVDDLLDVTRFARGQFELKQERMALDPVLEDVVTRFQLVAPKHNLELHLNGDRPTGNWDHDRLEQVMNNLVGNAIKYSPEGGVITVSAHPAGDNVVIAVRDHGLGIPEADQEHLFERFFRGSAEGQDIKGMGLGLYVTKRIVEAHGGSISLQSTPGQGSEFRFTLPLSREHVAVD
ncbi:MAG: hypothetical protein NVS2B16_01910 [Chloroflexota bacterium]